MSSTPTPWVKRICKADPELEEIYGADGRLVYGDASCWGFNDPDDCELAFTAVNDRAKDKALIAEYERILTNELVENDGDGTDDECEFCDGCGEISAHTKRDDTPQGEPIPCPLCAERGRSQIFRAALAKAKDGGHG